MGLAVYQDLEVNKGSRLVDEFQLVDKAGVPINITGFEYKLVIKESEQTETVLYEANLIKVDNLMGIVRIAICPSDLEIVYPVLPYWITQVNPLDDCDVNEIMTGKFLIK